MKSFASRVIHWQQQHGRHFLPWQDVPVDASTSVQPRPAACGQGGRDPYRIWLSEIMLQQTQVATVIPYFNRFVSRFPDLDSLAAAHEDEVLSLWSGLGYYSRARNLHAAARSLVEKQGGKFPVAADAIAQLPGIGRSTAGAIAALAFGQHCAILDGNVKRVLARHGGITGWPGDKKVEALLWQRAEAHLPRRAIEAYTQGMMDLGALVCTRSQPACTTCPLNADCHAYLWNRTGELPTPRPKKTLPERQVQMLILHQGGELMLEKRPARGIWGGLWSLPELAIDADPGAHCRDHFGFTTLSQQALPQFTHCFTHFKLHIRPVRLHLAARTTTPAGHIWLPRSDALDAALPAPIRTLVQQLETL